MPELIRLSLYNDSSSPSLLLVRTIDCFSWRSRQDMGGLPIHKFEKLTHQQGKDNRTGTLTSSTMTNPHPSSTRDPRKKRYIRIIPSTVKLKVSRGDKLLAIALFLKSWINWVELNSPSLNSAHRNGSDAYAVSRLTLLVISSYIVCSPLIFLDICLCIFEDEGCGLASSHEGILRAPSLETSRL